MNDPSVWLDLPALLASILLLDAFLGEPPNALHPVAWFGRAADGMEKICRRFFGSGIFSGFVGWLLLTVPPSAAVFFLVRYGQTANVYCGFACCAVIGYFTVALRSLLEHSRRIRKPLMQGDLGAARRALSMIVSRKTETLDESEIVRGGVESLGENLIDAVTGALFWIVIGYACGGLPGAAAAGVFLRCVNTLDACWGYRNERYLTFGRVAAKTDDWIFFLPARLTLPAVALGALLTGGSFTACLKTGWKHRKHHPSPNSCYGMAGFAGALGIRLGGPTEYSDGLEPYSRWGEGRSSLDWRDLRRAEWLTAATAVIFAGCLSGIWYGIWWFCAGS
ncbi:MAG: cobalamin biosynthesis protein CobD [Lentisphaeria bacterium]|nr:cobalamin biosynthesis protein CobD [Lentisphaeria bacterium]